MASRTRSSGPGTAAQASLGKARASWGACRRCDASRRGGVRPGAGARLARADAGRAEPRHPERDRPRLRVRLAPASARAAGGDTGRLPGGDSRRTARTIGAKPPKLVRYPGIEEEYYLADFEPDPAALDRIDPRRCSRSCGRRRTSRSTTGTETRSSPRVLERLGRDESVHAVVLPRTAEQRQTIRALGLPSLHVPEHAVDAQSLVALRRSRRFGRRDDEPRGRRTRRTRVHDVHGPDRRASTSS